PWSGTVLRPTATSAVAAVSAETNLMKFKGPHFRTTVMLALTAATALVAVGLRAVPLQGPPGQSPSATERFHGRAVVAGEVLVAFRLSPNIASLRADIDADADSFVGPGQVW